MEGFLKKVKKRLGTVKKLPMGRPDRSGFSLPDKAKPFLTNRKKYIAWGCAGTLVLLLAIMPMAATARQEESHQASILSGQAQLRDLET